MSSSTNPTNAISPSVHTSSLPISPTNVLGKLEKRPNAPLQAIHAGRTGPANRKLPQNVRHLKGFDTKLSNDQPTTSPAPETNKENSNGSVDFKSKLNGLLAKQPLPSQNKNVHFTQMPVTEKNEKPKEEPKLKVKTETKPVENCPAVEPQKTTLDLVDDSKEKKSMIASKTSEVKPIAATKEPVKLTLDVVDASTGKVEQKKGIETVIDEFTVVDALIDDLRVRYMEKLKQWASELNINLRDDYLLDNGLFSHLMVDFYEHIFIDETPPNISKKELAITLATLAAPFFSEKNRDEIKTEIIKLKRLEKIHSAISVEKALEIATKEQLTQLLALINKLDRPGVEKLVEEITSSYNSQQFALLRQELAKVLSQEQVEDFLQKEGALQPYVRCLTLLEPKDVQYFVEKAPQFREKQPSAQVAKDATLASTTLSVVKNVIAFQETERNKYWQRDNTDTYNFIQQTYQKHLSILAAIYGVTWDPEGDVAQALNNAFIEYLKSNLFSKESMDVVFRQTQPAKFHNTVSEMTAPLFGIEKSVEFLLGLYGNFSLGFTLKQIRKITEHEQESLFRDTFTPFLNELIRDLKSALNNKLTGDLQKKVDELFSLCKRIVIEVNQQTLKKLAEEYGHRFVDQVPGEYLNGLALLDDKAIQYILQHIESRKYSTLLKFAQG